MSSLADRYSHTLDRIASAARRAGRNPESVKLVAVSKGRALADVYDLHALGQRDFGENRAEEGGDKINAARRDHKMITWHMIGHVQRRKARDVVADFDWVHSVDGVPLSERLNRAAGEIGRRLPILLECNVSGEESKYGLAAHRWDSDPAQWEALCAIVGSILAQPNLRLRGLMTMAPIVPDPELARPVFRSLRALRDRFAAQFPSAEWGELSMGMTDDFEVAIEEGATLVRIGRAIFQPQE
ncbi:MAG: YggS family pyridoxal phosphate-dependent enzyme [Chloroflexi bacterium]|nr:YggS family pyridoxal phosphate-dependent enzyme [Chloroflexota bacterium]